MNDPIVRIENVSKNFGTLIALSDVSNHIDRGEVVVVIGPSGSGKSTLLRTPSDILFAYSLIAAMYFVYCYPVLRFSNWGEKIRFNRSTPRPLRHEL